MSLEASSRRRPWKSLGSADEIAAESPPVAPDASRVKVHFTAPRDIFVKRRGVPYGAGHNTKDPMDDPADLRSVKDPTYDLQRLESEMGVHAMPQLADMATQTPTFRRTNACIQAEPEIVDARLQPGNEPPTMEPKLRGFLDRVMPRMLHHLTLNKEVGIYGDDYTTLTEEDAFVASREDNFLREAGNFSHRYTKERSVASIDWRGGAPSVVAVACIDSASFVDRVELQKEVRSSVSVVWNFADPMYPQYVLEAPNEVLVIKFNPTSPHLIVGGCINGQMCVWDVSRAQDAKAKVAGKGSRAQQHAHNTEDVTAIPPMPEVIRGHTLERDGEAMVPRLQPSLVSRVEQGHRRTVHDICWLPEGTELGFDGKLFPAQEAHQFASLSEDGTMCIWDLRPENLPADKLRKMKHQGKTGGDDKMWVPLLRFNLTRPDGSGELLGLRFQLEGKPNGPPSYTMVCTTVEGELAVCHWGPKDEKAGSGPGQFGDDANRKEARVVRSITTAHAGPAWSVQRHPQLPDYYLTVGDWGFKVWKIGLPQPIVSSPCGESQMMCGRWSPTRASVVFIGTHDGFIQVWDLLDRSHEPVLVHALIQDAITTIEFKPAADRAGRAARDSQLVVLGTRVGSFHLFELPKVLVRGHSQELRNMRQLLEREVRRVSYFAWRWRERQRELDRAMQDKAEPKDGKGAKGAAAADDDGADDDGEYSRNNEFDLAFLQQVEELSKKEGDVVDE